MPDDAPRRAHITIGLGGNSTLYNSMITKLISFRHDARGGARPADLGPRTGDRSSGSRPTRVSCSPACGIPPLSGGRRRRRSSDVIATTLHGPRTSPSSAQVDARSVCCFYVTNPHAPPWRRGRSLDGELSGAAADRGWRRRIAECGGRAAARRRLSRQRPQGDEYRFDIGRGRGHRDPFPVQTA